MAHRPSLAPGLLTRRAWMGVAGGGLGGLLLPPGFAQAPSGDPAADLGLAWTGRFGWDRVVDIRSMPGKGDHWDARLAAAQEALGEDGGVVWFPAGEYTFADSIRLRDGVTLRGADPGGRAHDKNYAPPSRLSFPRYKPVLKGEGTPIDSAFKGIHLANPERGDFCGVVNLSIDRGHIHFGETEEKRCGGHRIVYGCVLRNAAVADPKVPDVGKLKQHAWQRFTSRHHAAIDVKGQENVLIANNRLPPSGDENFEMDGYILKPGRGSPGPASTGWSSTTTTGRACM